MMMYKVLFSETNTCYVTGDGFGGTEKKLGTVDTPEQCTTLVKTQEPTANGATFTKGEGTCAAEFGMTGSNSNADYLSCLFEGKVTP